MPSHRHLTTVTPLPLSFFFDRPIITDLSSVCAATVVLNPDFEFSHRDQFKISKWEASKFIFYHKDCGYQGFSWPRRNFTCNFCKKEYKSAQALGGHMNIHRRDKARLEFSSPPYLHPNPNPNPNYRSPPARYLPYHSSLFPTTSAKDEQQKLMVACSGPAMEDHERNGTRVWKKYEILNMEMEMLKDHGNNIELDLELRLGRS
ncbi:hypothetical protein L1987_29152 [Smallanthus sonchifolius]|uniref:Uncharacterized protein n=1 Tax=Smallanthus sonchifolius TaxID=185202 RepID=A0ACB9HZY7_9ASTR|nr:hypothetical protein L1987_29152 [Smallanthus sonchifolius]